MAAKSNLNAESNGGFKTVAFGFDKNDVNMYIANLRKRMKTMEEEFEQKLASALENPAASNDALKHEREVIRSETEKLWGEKLNERNQILKQQQVRIDELEEELRINKEKVASLRTQLSAATSDSNSDGVISARAAKAYMQFTRELRFISSSVEKTLEKMEQQWRGEFGSPSAVSEANGNTPANGTAADVPAEAAETHNESDNNGYSAANYAAADMAAAQNTKKEADLTDIDSDLLAEPLPEAAVQNTKPRTVTMDIDSDLLAEPLPEAPAPAKTSRKTEAAEPYNKMQDAPPKPAETEKTALVSDVKTASEPSSSASDFHKPAAKRISMPEKTVSKAAVENVDYDMPAEKSEAKPVPKASVSDGFDSLLLSDSSSDNNPETAPAASHTTLKAERAKSHIEIDDDLSALLADDLSDLLVSPADNAPKTDDDFEKFMASSKAESDYGEDIFVSENDTKVPLGDDLDATLLSDIVINPGEIKEDLSEMLKQREKTEEDTFKNMFVTAADESDRSDGLGINVGSIDFSMDSAEKAEEKNDTSQSAEKEYDPFDFSFLSAESDDEDDMSTDASFPGML